MFSRWLVVFGLASVLAACQSPPKREAQAPTVQDPSAGAPLTPSGEPPAATEAPGTVEPKAPATGEPAKPEPGKPSGTPPIRANVPEPKEAPKPSTEGWGATRLAPSEFARRLSKSMGSKSGAEGKATVFLKTPEGTGVQQLEYKLASPTKFRIDFLEMGAVPRAFSVTANGKQKWANGGKAPQLPVDVAARVEPKYLGGDPNVWIKDFTRAMFADLIDRSDPFTPLLNSLTSKKDQFRTVVEERRMPFKGKTVLNYRIYVERTGAGAKTAGPATFELIVDSVNWLPVTARSAWKDGQGEWTFEWAGMWRFGQKFDDKLFARPVAATQT